MANYTGAKCEYCHKVFEASDDIVVCPQCGTPYHRECYSQAGECINKELHERGGEWSAPPKYADREVGERRCPRCGESNPSSGLFCIKCGMPLNNQNNEARPFNGAGPQQGPQNYRGYAGPGQYGGQPYQGQGQSPFGMPFVQEQYSKDSVIDGHTVGEYAKFIKNNAYYHILQFIRFARMKTKMSVNFCALIFTEFYYFYRKMYKQGVIFLTLLILLSVPYLAWCVSKGMLPNITLPQQLAGYEKQLDVIVNICSMGTCAVRVVSGVLANYWYYRRAKKVLDAVEQSDASQETKEETIVKYGGTSMAALIVSLTVYVAAVILILMGIVAL